MRFVGLLSCILIGCASAPLKPHVPLFSGLNIPETQPLPNDPGTDPSLSKFPGTDDQVVDISKGNSAPFDGFVISEHRAARDLLYIKGYKNVMTLYTADRSVWGVQRDIYETQLAALEKQIHDMEPNWWVQHAGAVGFVSGAVLTLTAIISVGLLIH